MYENTGSGYLTHHILSHEYQKAKKKHSQGTRRLTNPVSTSGFWNAKTVRLQPLSLDRKGLVTQAKDCDPSNNLLDPLFVLAGERGRARAIAIAPPSTTATSTPEAQCEQSESVERRPPRRIASEARAPATQPPGAIDIAASATGRSTKRGSRRWLKEQFEPV